MATAWLIKSEGTIDAVASTAEVAINWMLEHEYARLDDEPIVDVYNEDEGKWEVWSMVKVAEYFGCSPMEALKKLLSFDYDEDIFNWGTWLEEVDWIG